MDSIQTQARALPACQSQSEPATASRGSDATQDAQMGFQGLLLGMMGLPISKDAAAEAEAKTGIPTDDAEHASPPAAPAGLYEVPALPIVLPPPPPTAATSDLQGQPVLTEGTLAPAVAKPFDNAKKLETGTVDLHAKKDAFGLEKNLPQFQQPTTDTHTDEAVTANLQRSLEAIAEHRDAAVSNLPLPHSPGLHPPHPTQSAQATPNRIDAPLGTPEWNTECAQRIVWLAAEKQQAAELHVNPPNLGPLHIRLTTDDTQTSAIFTSPHSEVREAIEAALPRLREVLADSGITLGNASVTADSPRDGSAFAQPRHYARADSSASTADATPELASTRILPRARGHGLVDLFA